jgi:uncharacterized iron-regulated membrane protein
MSTTVTAAENNEMGVWQRWLQHPERLWLHKLFFQIHYAAGIGIGLYVIVVGISGSIIVYRNELSPGFAVEWLVKLHENLLFGNTGRLVNGIGSLFLTLVCLTGAVIWWPGIRNWRRSLTVKWNARLPRFSWDLHSALGFWTFPFILMWGVSGIYFSFPDAFNSVLAFFDPGDRFYDRGLFWLSEVHFGRFGWFTEALWSAMGLVLALLSISGVFVCCHRLVYKKSANPNRQNGVVPKTSGKTQA